MSCYDDPACSHALVAAATLEATNLSDKEREIILAVLGRDELLRQDQQHRITHLKAELQNLRRKGALRPSADWDSTGPDPDRSCGRCRVELGRVINRGAYCRACRLKVCKSCREYSFRTTDWVCTVCHKHMEIQAASGEWMNEFVRRPSRRRDNRVYVPAADIIKRTIRRSWTISNPTPRWTVLRGSPELRPYNSLPRGTDINNYPALALHQNLKNIEQGFAPETGRRHSPCRRTRSEDVYNERPAAATVAAGATRAPSDDEDTAIISTKRPARVNPLMRLAEAKQKTGNKGTPPRRKSQQTSKSDVDGAQSTTIHVVAKEKNEGRRAVTVVAAAAAEKRVSFDSTVPDEKGATVCRAQSLQEGGKRERRAAPVAARSLTEDCTDEGAPQAEIHYAKEETAPVELCDIEPLSGTVFRKVTVRRRRQDMRKIPAVDTGWRRGGPAEAATDLIDILLPEGDDYKLVFISSDSSSKEEDIDDNDSSSTASSFPIDECDWDYFEPGSCARPVLNWTSPFGSPRVLRRGVVVESPLGSPLVYRRRRESDTGTDEDNTRLDSGSPASSDGLFAARCSRDSTDEVLSDQLHNERIMEEIALKCVHQADGADVPQRQQCQSCGAPTQYIPIPVPVPIPFPVPTLWTPQDSSVILYGQQNVDQNFRVRNLPRNLLSYMSQAALIWPLINAGEHSPLHSVLENNECTTSNAPTTTTTTTTPPSSIAATSTTTTTATTTTTTTATSTTMPSVVDRNSPLIPIDEQQTNNDDNNSTIDANAEIPTIIGDYELSGYLESENKYASSLDSSKDSSSATSSDSDGGEARQPRVQRIYNINDDDDDDDDDDDGRESDDALPSSNVTSDCDDGHNSHSSNREDMSSSGSADTDSDDTGTVADQKPKRFSRTFVVNKNLSSSSNESSSDSDTSDNDTDTERDCCTVILTNVKHLSEDTHILSHNNTIIIDQGIMKCNANLMTNNDCCSDIDNNDNTNLSDCDKLTNEPPVVVVGGVNLSEQVAKSLVIDFVTGGKKFKDNDYISSSPGLSDVSAESLNSSDVELVRDEMVEPPQQLSSSTMTAAGGGGGGGVAGAKAGPNGVLHVDYTPVIGGGSEWNNAVAGIRSTGEPVNVVGESSLNTRLDGEQRAGALVTGESDVCSARHAARYTSLVMITQEPAPSYQQVSVVTSDTTTLVADNDVVVRHTNWQDKRTDETRGDRPSDNQNQPEESVTVITGGDTLSAFEEGLADDDSWVENLSHDEDDDFGNSNSPTDDSTSGEEVTLTCSAAIDQEDELRGYHRAAIDFTLHTIVEESCEESEVELSLTSKEQRPTPTTDLEKYFFFRLGDGTNTINREDAFSESSSICSEGLDSLGGPEEIQQQNDNSDMAELASSRLEKYFLTGFMGFPAERRDSDGSVGSDSEGRPSPEQRRKRLVRARGAGRSHSSSLDNLLLTNPDLSGNDQSSEVQNSENSSSSDSDTYDEINNFEKSDGQFDTVKRKKGKKQKISNSMDDVKNLEPTQEVSENANASDEDEDGHKTPQPEILPIPSNLTTNKNQQSRDSGFIGSCDDLLKEQRDNITPELPHSKHELKLELENIAEERKIDGKCAPLSTPPATSLTRKDSFNNWSSDEETNLMMCKMRQFFKTMVANSQCNPSSKPTTPILGACASPKPIPSPRVVKNRCKPPQLVYFENELTRLMKTVPGIRDDQVREIVEYLSSEDTWSDSYDSSDYTSSDLEGTTTKSALQQQISDSCKQIINKFENGVDDEEGDEGDGGIVDESHGLNRETAFVYQKLVASFEKMATGDNSSDTVSNTPHNSPPLIAKVMHHIGSRLVALMHEVSSGESHASNSPKTRHYHRRLQQKLSSASTTTTEDDDSTSDSNLPDTLGALEDTLAPYNLLPRSRSHDLLVGESRGHHQSSSGVSDIAEERETSDCERFSWRGSFESALLATDSRNKLSLLGGEGSTSASALALAAKRRSAGDLLFSHKSLSREQLDRVRSCGSIGGANSEDKLWVASSNRPTRRRSSVPDATCGSGGSADGEDDDDEEDEDIENRATLPRSLQSGAATTNSLPRLPTNTPPTSMQKAQSMYHFLPPNAKSARYRPPGFNRLITTVPKRAVSAPGLQPTHQQRRGRRSQQYNVPSDDISISEAHSSPMLASRNGSKSATPSPVAPSSRRTTGSISSQDWSNVNADDDIVAIHQTRSSLSSLGLRSDSMASVYSGAGEGRYGTVAVRGQVEFGLQYNYKAGALEILIKQCKDLAPVDAKRNRSDPYVKVYLLPDKSKSGKRKTKVKKHTLNPVFEECLKFHISLNGLETRTLWLTVWHSDMFGRNDFLGEVMMALENKVFDDPTPVWYNLQERTEPFDDMLSFKGDIIVCLKFVPPDMTVHKKGKRSRGTLHVLVKEAKSLTAVKANGTSDPFCKSYLLPDKGRSSKQKTPVAKRTVNPIWNYTFVYDDVTLQELAERCLELTVWDHDRLASNEFLGGVRFSLGTGKHYGKSVDWMDATGKEHSLWKSMLERPNFWVEGCLSLRPSLDARTS